MAKQPNKSARDDSSAGRGAAAVSGNTGTVAAAKAPPVKTPEAPAAVAAEQSAMLDDGALLAVVKSMSDCRASSPNLKRRRVRRRRIRTTHSIPCIRGSLLCSASSAPGSRQS
jgi:hypothetical protein